MKDGKTNNWIREKIYVEDIIRRIHMESEIEIIGVEFLVNGDPSVERLQQR